MIWQMIEDWFRGILTDGILSNLSGLFDSVNTEVGEIATQVGTTPAAACPKTLFLGINLAPFLHL